MKRGGPRPNAGRPRVLSASESERIGKACERVWYWHADGRRPYDLRPYVLLSAAIVYSERFARFITTRRVEAAWKETRSLGIDRAQPLELAYEDARAIDHFLFVRKLRKQADLESPSSEAFYNWLEGGPPLADKKMG
jgi:hypothetical protein